MLSHYLIKTITDIEEVIKDYKAGILNEDDFRGQIAVLADRIVLDREMSERVGDNGETEEELKGSAEFPLGGSLEPYDIARDLAHEKEVDDLIGYAVKEGYIGDEAENWSAKEKEDYYDKSMAYEPQEEDEER